MRVNVQKFALLINKFLNLNKNPSEMEKIIEIIDIDKDGFIDKYDLETFLNRYSFMEKKVSRVSNEEILKVI